VIHFMKTASTGFERQSGAQQRHSVVFFLLSTFCIGLMFLAVSLLSSPIPGVNEPHYLCKARSFVDADWCHRDFFLASANAHYCFFWLVGPLTQLCSFAMAAQIGRSVSAFVLAGGWTVLGRATGLSISYGILSAAVYAFLSQLGSFSGEWLLDGFESKVAAWGLGLAAIGFWIRGSLCGCPRWMAMAGFLCGIGATLHPVVGGWIAVCICMAWLFDWVAARCFKGRQGAINSVIGIITFSVSTIVVALPGLIPAFQLLLDDSLGREDRELASFIQVFWRLKHHLDPTELTTLQWMYAGGLLTIAILAFVSWHAKSHAALLLKFFFASLAVALAGVAIGWHTVEAKDMNDWQWRAALLKFYPFRTFDAMLPIVAAIFVALKLQHRLTFTSKKVVSVVVIVFCGLAFVPAALHREITPPGYTADQFTEWQTVCEWIRAETPDTALFLTPRESFAFKWFAERAEYVCYKDCPQDAVGILEWNRRLWWLHDWTLKSSTDGVYDRYDLEELRAKTDCDFILTRMLGPFNVAPVWQGKHWQIIKIP